MILALLLHVALAADANWGRNIAYAGVSPAVTVSVAALTGAAATRLPAESAAYEVGEAALGGALLLSPVAAVGSGMMAGGSLMEASGLGLADRGWGWGAAALAGGGSLSLAAAFAVDKTWPVALGAGMLMGAQAASIVQLAKNQRFRALEPVGAEARYDAALALAWAGGGALGAGALSGVAGAGLIWVYQRAVDRASGFQRIFLAIVLSPVAAMGAVGLGAAVPFSLMGTGFLASSGLQARGALVDGGAAVSGVLGGCAVALLLAVPTTSLAAIITEKPVFLWIGAGLWTASLGLSVAQLAVDRAAYRAQPLSTVWTIPLVSTSF